MAAASCTARAAVRAAVIAPGGRLARARAAGARRVAARAAAERHEEGAGGEGIQSIGGAGLVCLASLAVPLALVAAAEPAHAAVALSGAHPSGAAIGDLAGSEWEGFFENFAKFFTFSASVFIGGTYVMIKPLIDLAKKSPLGFIGVSAGAIGAVYGTILTVKAMTGEFQVPPPI